MSGGTCICVSRHFLTDKTDMTFPENFETKTGFDKIRILLKKYALSPLGCEKVDEMTFSTHYEEILEGINQTNEFTTLLEQEDFPQDAFYDMRESLDKIHIEGTFIEEDELFNLRKSLDMIGKIVKFFDEKEGGEYYYLKELSKDVFVFPDIIRLIDRILDKFGRIKDNASPELAEIRRSILNAQGSVSRTLNHILQEAQSHGFVEKDTKPTLRDGRLVIPVPPANKRQIRGIVHDESATGKTVFIEPEAVVEINNRVRELLSEEKREIIRILTQISNELRPRIPEMVDSFQYLAQIDFIRSKALFAKETDSVLPHVHNEQTIDWAEAKHPILLLSHRKAGKPVIPLSITLNQENRILLISGPNAGGKSVCLKTVGLLQYMLQCGMLVPLHPSSEMGIFNNILIDIGDEQSIENDLSTYSSHLNNMKQFVRHCDNKSILLIDEFGGGTEPRIGGAIAEALLNLFNQKKAFGVITTHYTNLKDFAKETDGIINGAMLYDRHEMRPLYQLEIGNPGSSFAIEIARKIGLPESVIQEAISKVGEDYVNLDKYLQDIVRDKRYWEGKRQNIRQKEKRIEELEEKYQQELETISAQRKEIIREAKQESQRILDQANAVIENTVRKIKEAQAEKEKTKEARTDLEKYKEQNKKTDSNSHSIDQKIERLKQKSKAGEKKSADESEKLAIGSNVRIKGQSSFGTLLEIRGENAVVAFGLLKTNVKLKQLEAVSKNKIKKESTTHFVSESTTSDIRGRSLNFKREIDVRGMRGDEALQAVTYFIDDAIILNIDQVRILHGTGTGILRQLIRDYLKTIPEVKSAVDEHVEFGGAGITVVKF